MRTPRFWHQTGWRSHLLLPLAALYGIGARIDRARHTPQPAALPVIAIGNVTAGGAGKTPTTLALAQLLQQHGAIPHIISRGYGGSARTPRAVTPQDDWRLVGDEALLLARTAPTWVARNRIETALAAHHTGATLAIADDALQHYALRPNLTLLVIDGAFGVGNGRLLPAGPLRESLASALKRCDAVVMIGDDAHQLTAHIDRPILHARLDAAPEISHFQKGIWLAFAGLGRPDKFYALLRQHGVTLAATVDFADHHPYTDADVETLLAKAKSLGARLVTTEKDFVKIPARYREQVHVLPIALQFADPQSVIALCRCHGILRP